MPAQYLVWGLGGWLWLVGGPVALGLSMYGCAGYEGKLTGSCLGLFSVEKTKAMG